MTTAQVLIKEKIVSVSDLQKNPLKALDGKIIRIVKNGKEIGIFMSKDEFEDFIEDNLELKASFKEDLETATKELSEILIKLDKKGKLKSSLDDQLADV